MADEPVDLTTRILRQVQETQADHTRMLADHSRILEDHGRTLSDLTRRFDSFERLMLMVSERVAEIQNGMVTTISYAASADARSKDLRQEVDDLKRRVDVLEEKV